MLKEDILSSAIIVEDKNLDLTLRPKRFSDFIGQDRIKENLFIYIEAAKKRGEPLDHILFSGPPGLGKTTLSQIIANEINTAIKTTSGPIMDLRQGRLKSICQSLRSLDRLPAKGYLPLPFVPVLVCWRSWCSIPGPIFTEL